MSVDASLFGDDEPQEEASKVPAPAPIGQWQIDLLRKALDARALPSMADRQRLIEEVVGRPVESLRALTHEEALRALSELGRTAPTTGASASAWDERDEDTWIDRL